MKDEFERMWNDTANYKDFYPLKPNTPGLVAPATGAVDVSTLPKLEWKQTPWAVTFDVYLGTSTSNMTNVARVNAVLNENPPAKYSYTVTQALQPSTKYFWKVVSRTFATDVDPTLIATSSTFSFTTGAGTGGGGGSGPYTGSPVALPGTIQAENFDKGGSGIAYNDTTSSNQGGQYRTTEAVDIEVTSDTGGGYDIGWTAPGEWLNYTVNVATAGTYTIEARVAAGGAGGTFHIEANGVDKTGPMTIPNTGGWQTWTTISKSNVSLSAGAQIWRLVIDSAGSVVGNFNYIRVSSGGGGGPVTSTPYGGTPAPVPGTIEAENFDEGGSGVAYVDNSPTNQGGKYRTNDAVDIESTTDVGGGYDVGYVAAGEWMKYTVNVTTAGTYDIEFRVASSGGGRTFHLEINGTNVTGSLVVPNTGGWQTWTTIKKTGVTLNAGSQVWTFVADSGGSGSFGNLNYIRVAAPAGGGGGPQPFSGTPSALPGILQFENFDEGGANVAYVDTSSGNAGGKYRSTDVDIESTSGGFDVGWVAAGEWLNYTVDVSTAGTYNLDISVASSGAGGTFHIEVNGVDKTGSISVPNTGGWQTWQTIQVSGVTLAAGTQVWRVVMDTNGPTTGAVGNLNWLQATPQ